VSVEIRTPRSEDGDALAAIYGPHVTDGVASFELVAPHPDQMAARVSATLRTHPFLVAERDGVVVGFAYGATHHARAAYRWVVDVSVYIAATARRQGVGRALYSELLSRLRRQGFVVACAGVTLPNDASVALHEAFGFEPIGIYREIGFKMGKWHDVGYWQLELAPRSGGPPAEPMTAPEP